MNGKKLITVLLLLFLLAIPMQALAMETATAEISFTVKNAPGTVVMEALRDAPEPEKTAFDGASAGTFVLSFNEPGDYYYEIYQKTQTQTGVTYDDTVYEVWISVLVDDDGKLYSVAAVNAQDSTQKTDEILFENTPVPSSEPSNPTTTDVPDTPYTGDSSRLPLWIALMAVSFFGLVGSIRMRKKAR